MKNNLNPVLAMSIGKREKIYIWMPKQKRVNYYRMLLFLQSVRPQHTAHLKCRVHFKLTRKSAKDTV